MKTITLTRINDDLIQAIGKLAMDGFNCCTLEKPWKENQMNISCIPKGLYQCKWTFSWKLMRYTYQVMNVKDRSGIRFHPGNYFFDIGGCILLGDSYKFLNSDKELDIVNSSITMSQFEKLLNKEEFTLNII